MLKLFFKGIKNLILAVIMLAMIIGVLVLINWIVEVAADFISVYFLTFVFIPVGLIMLAFFME